MKAIMLTMLFFCLLMMGCAATDSVRQQDPVQVQPLPNEDAPAPDEAAQNSQAVAEFRQLQQQFGVGPIETEADFYAMLRLWQASHPNAVSLDDEKAFDDFVHKWHQEHPDSPYLIETEEDFYKLVDEFNREHGSE